MGWCPIAYLAKSSVSVSRLYLYEPCADIEQTLGSSRCFGHRGYSRVRSLPSSCYICRRSIRRTCSGTKCNHWIRSKHVWWHFHTTDQPRNDTRKFDSYIVLHEGSFSTGFWSSGLNLQRLAQLINISGGICRIHLRHWQLYLAPLHISWSLQLLCRCLREPRTARRFRSLRCVVAMVVGLRIRLRGQLYCLEPSLR